MSADYEIEESPEPLPAAGYRTYEVYQRTRVGETTNLLKPRRLVDDDFLRDPYPTLGVLRENYPCYRDWPNNRFWVTRYDDVTSVIADDANFETRTKQWFIGRPDLGRNLWDHVPVLIARASRIDAELETIVARVIGDVVARAPTGVDVAADLAGRLPIELWAAVLDLPADDMPVFASRYWRMQRGAGWDPQSQHDGLAAIDELIEYFTPLIEVRRHTPGDDLVSAVATLELPDGAATAHDLVATLLESDHETLHGGLANLWFLLLTHPEQLAQVRDDDRLMKFAWLEALRHSPAVLSALRFTRHEVERFGRLLPEGALVECSAAAANRDPRAFSEPDSFFVNRSDLCQREPRGQYRADGLPSGVAVGLGKPSVHPAEPKDRPRSIYAITRDVAVAASRALLEAAPTLSLVSDADADVHQRSLHLGEMHACWHLPCTT